MDFTSLFTSLNHLHFISMACQCHCYIDEVAGPGSEIIELSKAGGNVINKIMA